MPSHIINPDTTIYYLAGGSGTGPTLIFLHFWGGSSKTYSSVLSALPYQKTLAIDFRGWGHSIGPPTPSAYSVLDHAKDVESLIQKLQIKKYILIGHSMGAKVAQLIAGRNQNPGLKGLILLAPAPPTPLILPEDMKEQQISAYSCPEAAEFVVRNVLTSSPVSDQQVKSLVEDMLKGNEYAKKAWPAYAMGEDILEQVRGIRTKVLVIVGAKDKVEVLEKVRKEVLGNIMGAELKVLEGNGHLVLVEKPEEVAELIAGFVGSL
jgi:3-oxoadipate enol-lactonase